MLDDKNKKVLTDKNDFSLARAPVHISVTDLWLLTCYQLFGAVEIYKAMIDKDTQVKNTKVISSFRNNTT